VERLLERSSAPCPTSGSTLLETLQRDLFHTWKGYIRKPSGVLTRKNYRI